MRRYARIIRVLVDADGPLTALQIASRAGLPPGSLYVWLAAWERTETVDAQWLPGPYPSRRVYRITAGGLSTAAANGIWPGGDR